MDSLDLLLVGTSPSLWLSAHQPKPEDGEDGRWINRDQLLTGSDPSIEHMHRRLVDEGTRPAAAANYVAEWVGGTLAGHVGYALAMGGVGFEVDPDRVRWHVHVDGWTDAVDLSCARAIVDRLHPWATRHDVDVADTREEMLDRTMGGVVRTLWPVIEAIRALARVGRAGLWNEVVDGFAMSICFDRTLPVHPAAVRMLLDAIGRPARPWKATPTLEISTATFGPCYVGQKGGCCLAYTNRSTPPGGDVDFCSTCRFRTWDDCKSRQLGRFREQTSQA